MEVRSIETIVKALNAAQVQYLIVGGLAVGAHGYDRLTADVDLVIGLQPQNITLALRTLLAVGWRMSVPVTPEEFADPKLRESWRKEKNMIVLKLWSDAHHRTPIFLFMSLLISKRNLPAHNGSRWPGKLAPRLSVTKRFWP
jgi:hypothetical protein